MPMRQQYRWSISPPGDELKVRISNWEGDDHLLQADLRLQRVEFSAWQRMRVLVGYPLMTYRVITAIYWQAFRLWRKGCQYHPHPKTLTASPASKQIVNQ